MAKTKVCTKCGKRKPLGEYHADLRHKAGKVAACKECAAMAHARWYAKNRERRAASRDAWHDANKERKAATDAAWRAANKARIAATCAAWYQANREDCLLRSALNKDIRGGF